jgi:hypothetical protein
MEGNDLGTWNDRYYVVTMEPTICTPPELGRVERWKLERKPEKYLDDYIDRYTINPGMLAFIAQQGYQTVPVEIWGFGDRNVFDALCQIIDDQIGQYVRRYHCFDDEQDARAALTYDQGILHVYDADHDRVDRLWQFRGYRVLPGGTP